MSKPKYFTVEQADDTVIFAAIGSIGGLVEDAARTEWDALLNQVDAANATHAIIDLGALDYFGSIMLELLVVLWKRVSAKGGKLALCKVSPVGLEILHTAKFDTLWPIVADREEALEAVKG
ncbi:MAG: STAS domain-containing protein [Planctomycetaceae bacterium]|nr:STAS domain-containing protein [Planctomycetales bacterium]MCB9873829.1 STAS domain-containing protein [Planctomycetaceae bacterium]MCB9941437.1 STAS domain-containing protein [Planctomycetaceae bacterium]